MRKVTLTKDEASILHTAVNSGTPGQGLTLQEIRDAIPLLDKIEADGKELTDGNGNVIRDGNGVAVMTFDHDFELEFKESEYILSKTRLDNSGGWINVSNGRAVVKLADKFKELPSLEPSEPEEKGVDTK